MKHQGKRRSYRNPDLNVNSKNQASFYDENLKENLMRKIATCLSFLKLFLARQFQADVLRRLLNVFHETKTLRS